MRFSKKRGAIEVQFNWVFVLIVGALILAFFINISTVQKKNADQTLAFDLLSRVDLIMSGALTIPKTGQVFDMPAIDFGVECSRISTLGVSRQFPGRIVFSPDTLSGKRLVIWSQDWTVPFKVSNFLYLTTSNVRYVIVSDSNDDYAKQFYDSLPDNITKEIAPVSALNDLGNYKIRLIFLSKVSTITYDALIGMQLPAFMDRMSSTAVTGIYIDESILDSTLVRFIKKDTNNQLNFVGDAIPVYQEPMVFGAVFADSLEEFNCSIMKAFKKLHYVSEIYGRKESALTDTYSLSSMQECQDSATTRASDPIGSIANADYGSLSSIIAAIASNSGTVESRNNFAIAASCAPIY